MSQLMNLLKNKRRYITRLVIYMVLTPIGVACAQIEKKAPSHEGVVLTHGFGRTSLSLWRWSRTFKKSGYQVCIINYSSLRRKIEEIKKDVFEQIDRCQKSHLKKIHFVGYSLGGLLTRSYLEENKLNNLGHVVLVASPNQGTEFVDYYQGKWWLKILGEEIISSLSTKNSEFLDSLKDPYYKLGVIAGDLNLSFQEHVLPGQDDGIVRVESTKVKGMSDFVLIPKTTHGLLRYNTKAILQALHFLSQGKFKDLSSSSN